MYKNILNPVLFPVDTDNMEIINFVNQDYNEKKSKGFLKNTIGSFSVLRFNKNKEKKHSFKSDKNTVSYSLMLDYEFGVFRAGTVKKEFSLKNILISLGQFVSIIQTSLKVNYKKFIISLLTLLILSSVCFTTVKYINYKKNHIGPLTFNNSENYELEAINKMMTDFALETSVEIDEFGHVLGEEADVSNFVLNQPVTYQTYKVLPGDTIGGIAIKFGLSNISSLISVNNITNVRSIIAGQKILIPSIDGIMYTVKNGDSLNSIIEKNNVKLEVLVDVNDLTSDTLSVGQTLFLPGVSLDSNVLKNAMGEFFKIPIRASFRWTSPYGYRIDPIKNVKSFHTGTDLACPTGTAIYASMGGKVSYIGVSSVFGNYVVINHDNGYQTLYAHMSKILVKKGDVVNQDSKIGLVGSTGYSTGPHLHFTVYKNGKTIDPKTVLKN